MELPGNGSSLSFEEIRAQELLEEKESDGRLRQYKGALNTFITILFLVWAAFQLYANTIGVIDAMALRTWHL